MHSNILRFNVGIPHWNRRIYFVWPIVLCQCYFCFAKKKLRKKNIGGIVYACGCIFSVVWFIRFSSGVISLCYIHWHNNGYAKDEWITMFWFDFVLFSTPFIRRLFAHICVDFDTRTRTSRARMSIIMDMFWQIGWVLERGLQYVYRWIFHCREQTKRLKEKSIEKISADKQTVNVRNTYYREHWLPFVFRFTVSLLKTVSQKKRKQQQKIVESAKEWMMTRVALSTHMECVYFRRCTPEWNGMKKITKIQ